MITLPEGFNYALLLSDLWGCVLPFIPVVLLFVGYRYVKLAMARV